MNHHEEIIKEAEEDNKEPSNWYKGPIKIILGLFMLLLIIMMVVPFYGVKQNPEPNYTPTLEEVFYYNYTLSNKTFVIDSVSDFRMFVNSGDPVIKNTANKIVTVSCKHSNKVCYAKSLYYFIRDNFQYISDPVDFEYVEKTEDFLISGGGDCESGTLALANLIESVGIRTELVLIPGHAFLRINLPEAISSYKSENDWIYLDWTCKNCIFGERPYESVGKSEKYISLS
jgi:transglutaminase-like putative cysteine protease